jgi:mono/diheme cytochrome c family protein
MVLLFVPLLLLIGAGCAEGRHASDALESDVASKVHDAAVANGMRGPVALAGARVYAESGCASCHTYGGVGSSNLGAPDLTAEGSKGKGVRKQIAFLRCPDCVDSGSAMPPFDALGRADLRRLAVFLEASKGGG